MAINIKSSYNYKSNTLYLYFKNEKERTLFIKQSWPIEFFAPSDEGTYVPKSETICRLYCDVRGTQSLFFLKVKIVFDDWGANEGFYKISI